MRIVEGKTCNRMCEPHTREIPQTETESDAISYGCTGQLELPVDSTGTQKVHPVASKNSLPKGSSQ